MTADSHNQRVRDLARVHAKRRARRFVEGETDDDQPRPCVAIADAGFIDAGTWSIYAKAWLDAFNAEVRRINRYETGFTGRMVG